MSKELRVAHVTSVIDGRSQSGTARVASELIRSLSTVSYVKQFLFHFDSVEDSIYRVNGATEILIPKILEGVPGRRFVSFVLFCLLKRQELKALNLDVVHWHVGRVYPFFWLLPSKKVVVTVHDAGGYLLPGVNTFLTRIFRLSLRLFKGRITSIIVVSEDAKVQLSSVAPWFKNQITVMPLATNIEGVPSVSPLSFKKPDRYILCVSRWQPHKNVLTFVRAYKEAAVTLGDNCPHLVLVGKPRVENSQESAEIMSLRNELSATHFHEVSESELSYLYKNSLFSVFPSLHEGFGLAVLESMVFGKAVLVHEGTATSEILGIEELAINMRDQKAIRDSIIQLSSNDILLSMYGHLAKQQSMVFSWENSAAILLANYEKGTAFEA